MPGLVKEFKDFIAGGNLIELAVAFLVGGLFAKIVEAFVTFIVMPIISIVFGKPNFDEALIVTINDAQIKFGSFLTVAITVILTALAVFLFVVKPYNRMKRAKAVEAPAGPSEAELLGEIRDLLARR